MTTVSPHAQEDKPHYTYVLMYPEDYPEPEKADTIFYVGKGTSRFRIYYHEWDAKRGVNSYKCHVIRRIWSYGKEVVRKKIAFFATNEEACMHEIALIFFLPGLTNLTIGGDGIVGLPRTEEHNRKIGEAKRGKPRSEETIRRMSESNKGRKPSEETLRKLSEVHKGKILSEEHRRKLIEVNTGKHPSEETRRKLSEVHKGIKPSEETLRKRSEAMKGKKLSESARRKLSEARTGMKFSEETLRKLSESHSQIWPGFVAPDGTRYENVVNLRAFSLERGLDPAHMHEVARGKQSHHKGWKALQ